MIMVITSSKTAA